MKTTLLTWISDLVKKYNIDGLRIDTVAEVPKWFWKDFTEASGVYTVGEVFDGDMGYLAGYVGSVSACLNYPFFFNVRDIFFQSKNLYGMRTYYDSWHRAISEEKLQLMGNFIDNHDNARILSFGGDWESKKKLYKAVNALTLTSVGIPIIYYGAEQYFAGGNDPANREILWNHMDSASDMYQFIRQVNLVRKQHQIYRENQVERYVDNEIYAFSRGKVLVLLTNQVNKTVEKYISYHPYQKGEVICNIFYPDSDCITVSSGFEVYLAQGQVKIYVPK